MRLSVEADDPPLGFENRAVWSVDDNRVSFEPVWDGRSQLSSSQIEFSTGFGQGVSWSIHRCTYRQKL